jgi:pyridoxal phosphate enzyme (YggS family)
MSHSDICVNLNRIQKEIKKDVTLVAVSKTFHAELIKSAYDCGQRDFGENYVQEWLSKKDLLPVDIRWHFIGHLQTNKVKYIIPGIYLIHSVDSEKLLKEIQKQAQKKSTKVDVLLQVHISEEETKFGFDENELFTIFDNSVHVSHPYVRICGLMGMASFTNDKEKIRSEFKKLNELFCRIKEKFNLPDAFKILSMGMSSDYKIAIEEGSNMIRIGSAIFGKRNYGAGN